jgi:hypothetical protein
VDRIDHNADSALDVADIALSPVYVESGCTATHEPVHAQEVWTWLDNPFAVPSDLPGPEQVIMAF